MSSLLSRKGGNVMHQEQFVASLIRLSVIKYPQYRMVADRLRKLCNEK